MHHYQKDMKLINIIIGDIIKMNYIRTFVLFLCVFGLLYSQTSYTFGNHPRLYITSTDIPSIKNNYLSLKAKLNTSHVLFQALDFVLLNDTINGKKAVSTCLTSLKNAIDIDVGRRENSVFHYGACIYDWCYPLLTLEQKQSYITEFKRISNISTPYYPPKSNFNKVVGHVLEGWILTGQVPAGIAIYDEDPEMFNKIYPLVKDSILPVMDFYYNSKMHHQGDSYLGRFVHDLMTAIIFDKLGLSLNIADKQKKIAQQLLYNCRPDLLQMRDGDCFDYTGINGYKKLILMISGYYYKNSDYLYLWNKMIEVDTTQDAFNNVFYVILKNTTPINNTITLTSSTYFPSPIGEIVFRDNWNIKPDYKSVIIKMRIGEYFFSNHQTKSAGTFQIYYNGILATTSGFYGLTNTDHYKSYAHQTIAHNGLLVYDPSEIMNYYGVVTSNDGGQKYIKNGITPYDLKDLQTNYKISSVGSREIKSDIFSYISGNITNAYTSKVSLANRSMVAFNLKNTTYPSLFVVFDRLNSSNASFKKTWLLHSIKEPVINKTRIIITNDLLHTNKNGQFDSKLGYNSGKLITDCVLPKNASIQKVGGAGQEYLVQQTNYSPSIESIRSYGIDTMLASLEPSSWRVEVSPIDTNISDLFLHTMVVMDKSSELAEMPKSIETANMVGVIMLNKTVLFSKLNTLLTSINVSLNDATTDLLICDLSPGNWSVIWDSGINKSFVVSDTGNCIYIEKVDGNLFCKKN